MTFDCSEPAPRFAVLPSLSGNFLRLWRIFLEIFCFWLGISSVMAAPGDWDPGFQPLPLRDIAAVSVQTDGRIIVSPDAISLLRLRPDGR